MFRRWGVLIAAVLVGVGLAAPGSPAPAAGGLRAGVGVGDITPPVGTPMFAYTAREAVAGGVEPFLTQESFDTNFYAKTFVASVGVHTRVRARAVVLDQGGQRIALVQTDLGGFPYELHQAVVARISATGIGRDHLMMGATHTHGSVGPLWPTTHSGYAILGGDLFDPRVFDIVADGIAVAVTNAVNSLAPAKAGTATVEVADASRTRAVEAHRLNPDEPHLTRGDDAPHSLDAQMTVLRVDRADGTPLGLWTSFAIHGTAFGDEMLHFTGDNQAYAERIVEAELRRRGGLPADAVVVHALFNANEGDISPRGSTPVIGEVPLAVPPASSEGLEAAAYVQGQFAGAEMAGTGVAHGALAAWERAGRVMTDDLPLATRFSLLPLNGGIVNGEPVGLTAALGCGGVVCDDGMASPVDVPGQGKKIPVAAAPPGVLVPAFAPIQVVRLGGLVVAGAPFEVTKQMGVRIKKAVKAELTEAGIDATVAFAGLANGYASYMATPEEYEAYHYESSFTLYGRQQGPAVQNGLAELADALAEGTAAPTGMIALPYIDVPIPTVVLLPEPNAGTGGPAPATTAVFGTTEYSWTGGDPAIDDPHVAIQRQAGDGTWVTVATDDGYEDLVTHRRALGELAHTWTDTWEVPACAAPGSYRFVVAGQSGAGGYEVTSAPFAVAAAPAPTVGTVSVEPSMAWFRATYPAPAEGSTPMRIRPKFAEGGTASVVVTAPGGATQTVAAIWQPARLRYEAEGSYAAGSNAQVVAGSLKPGCGTSLGVLGAAVLTGGTGAGGGVGPAGPVLPSTGGHLPVLALAVLALAASFVGRRMSNT